MRHKSKIKRPKTSSTVDFALAKTALAGSWNEVILQIISGNETKLCAALMHYSRTLEKTRKQFGIDPPKKAELDL